MLKTFEIRGIVILRQICVISNLPHINIGFLERLDVFSYSDINQRLNLLKRTFWLAVPSAASLA